MRSIGKVKLKSDIRFTTNLFDDVTSIAGKTLLLIEKNSQGDCLCLYADGPYLVDVDYRDVESVLSPVLA